MIFKKQEKLIISLAKKKYRDKTKLFIAEGQKLTADLLIAGIKPYLIIATKEWHPENNLYIDIEPVIVSENIIKKLSLLKTPQKIIAIFHQPEQIFEKKTQDSLLLGLDGVQDPGNFGTILRIADWFGINCLICSYDTVDVYNPKVIQSSMGSIARVKVHYVNLERFCTDYSSSGNTIFGTFIKGENIYTANLENKGLIIIGNEGNGIRPEIEKIVTRKLTIPSFSTSGTSAESLNVSVATAIICSEFKRKKAVNHNRSAIPEGLEPPTF